MKNWPYHLHSRLHPRGRRAHEDLRRESLPGVAVVHLLLPHALPPERVELVRDLPGEALASVGMVVTRTLTCSLFIPPFQSTEY